MYKAFRASEFGNAYHVEVKITGDAEARVVPINELSDDTLPAQDTQLIPDWLQEDMAPLPTGVTNYGSDMLNAAMKLDHRDLPTLDKAAELLYRLHIAVKNSQRIERVQESILRPFLPPRLAHTTAASFVFHIELPLGDVEAHNASGLEPINRRAINRIMVGLSTAELANSISSEALIIENSDVGLDGNLCETFAKICDELDDFELELSINWSSQLEANPLVPVSTRLTKQTGVVLRHAASQVKRIAEEDLDVVGGVIATLDPGRYTPDIESPKGVQFAFEYLPGQVRTVLIELNNADYEDALRAHANRRLVNVKGRLNKSGKNWFIDNVTQFHVLDTSPRRPTEPFIGPTIEVTSISTNISRSSYLESRKGLIPRLKEAIINGILPSQFTQEDFEKWISEYNVRLPNGQEYSRGTVRNILNNYRSGSLSTSRGAEKGKLRRVRLQDIRGAITLYTFENV
jgi:hypothetical protein